MIGLFQSIGLAATHSHIDSNRIPTASINFSQQGLHIRRMGRSLQAMENDNQWDSAPVIRRRRFTKIKIEKIAVLKLQTPAV